LKLPVFPNWVGCRNEIVGLNLDLQNRNPFTFRAESECERVTPEPTHLWRVAASPLSHYTSKWMELAQNR